MVRLSAEASAAEEVNFWNPSAHYLFRGPVGSPFLFRLKAPINMIGGFGLVAYAERLPEWLAWECFGQANGAATLQEMRGQVARLREHAAITAEKSLSQIGCIILSQPVLFPPDLWIPQPTGWARANLRYAKYDLTGEGKRVWDACVERIQAASLSPTILPAHPAMDRYGAPVLIKPRLG